MSADLVAPACHNCGSTLTVDIELRVSVAPLDLDPLTLDLDEATSNGVWEFDVRCDNCGVEAGRYRDDEVEWR